MLVNGTHVRRLDLDGKAAAEPPFAAEMRDHTFLQAVEMATPRRRRRARARRRAHHVVGRRRESSGGRRPAAGGRGVDGGGRCSLA